MTIYGQPIVLNGKVYVRGVTAGTMTVCMYPGRDMWDVLPPPLVNDVTIVALKDKLVLVGGRDKTTLEVSNKITVWDSQSQQWVHPYPPMKTARTTPAAVGYGEYLIVAGGHNSVNRITDVNILDTTSSKWHLAESLPNTDDYNPVLIEDTLYLVGRLTRTVVRAYVPTLISQTSVIPIQNVWESLPNAPFYWSSPTAVANMLVTVGGCTNNNIANPNPITSIQLYNTGNKKWTGVGDLPEALHDCSCIECSEELLVLGGRKALDFIRSVYAAKLTIQ